MKTLTITQFKSTGLNPQFNSRVSTITLPDDFLGEGAFGVVYKCTVNGVEQAVKVFTSTDRNKQLQAQKSYETICALQDLVVAYNKQLKEKGEKPIEQMNALKALPLFSYKGRLNTGEDVMGYSTILLDKKQGWECFNDMLSETTDKDSRAAKQKYFYAELNSETRLKFVYDLLEGFKTLEAMRFIHADLNPQNFFINIKSGELCLIDYDSGGVNGVAETKGKEGHFYAPELRTGEKDSANFFTDYWSIAMVVHFFYFPFVPFFYLGKVSSKIMRDYFAKNQYPEISTSDRCFLKEEKNICRYKEYIKNLSEKVPPEIVELFKHSFQKGYFNPGARITSRQWFQKISPLVTKQYKTPPVKIPKTVVVKPKRKKLNERIKALFNKFKFELKSKPKLQKNKSKKYKPYVYKPKKSWSLFTPLYKYRVSRAIDDFFDSGKAETLVRILFFAIFAIFLIAIWATKGFWIALLCLFIGVFLAIFLVIVSKIGLKIIRFVTLAISYVIEWFCLIRLPYEIAVVVIAGLITYFISSGIDFGNIFQSNNQTEQIEAPQPVENYFYCNDNNINVREFPNTKSRILGKLQLNDKINVLSNYEKGFKKVEYKGEVGYVYAKFLQNTPFVENNSKSTTQNPAPKQPTDNAAEEKQNLSKAKTAFQNSNYDSAFKYYSQAGSYGKTDGYNAFNDKAKQLIGILGECDDKVKELLRYAQQLNNTQEIRNLINNCN
ncbi:MAG: SH3 domain-containing protein [Prevotellaceae bacterium]|jgi:serine/threonine protein kinase|nr:SH3 domain-containing protein [Prevotellaceae bacterium]